VSCYTRHLDEFLPAEPTAADKRALDGVVREVLAMPEPAFDCPDVWNEVKARREDPDFQAAVRVRLGEVA
jgi:hypothetical protein